MGPVAAVMLDVVGDQCLELVPVPDDGAVEELAADGSDPSFSERVGNGCPDGGLEDLDAFGAEDLVDALDGVGTLRVPRTRRSRSEGCATPLA